MMKKDIAQVKRALRVLHSTIDDHVRKADMQFTCRRGCAYCCKQVVVASVLEMVVAIAYVKKKNPERLESLYREINRQADLLLSGKSADEWFELQIPCVFLKSDNTCSVYSVRPTVCRSYNALSDPSNCAPPAGKTVKRLDLMPHATHAMNFFAELAPELPPSIIPMPVAARWAVLLMEQGLPALAQNMQEIEDRKLTWKKGGYCVEGDVEQPRTSEVAEQKPAGLGDRKLD